MILFPNSSLTKPKISIKTHVKICKTKIDMVKSTGFLFFTEFFFELICFRYIHIYIFRVVILNFDENIIRDKLIKLY